MADDSAGTNGGFADFAELLRAQSDAVQAFFGNGAPGGDAGNDGANGTDWSAVVRRMQSMWFDFEKDQGSRVAQAQYLDPSTWLKLFGGLPLAQGFGTPDRQKQFWEKGLSLWQSVLGQYGIGSQANDAGGAKPDLPIHDRRFADPKWSGTPFHALVHQSYLLLADELEDMADVIDGLEPAQREKLRFFTGVLLDAMSPANFLLTNPIAMERAAETKGESVIKGFEHLLADLKRGQLTHTDPDAFKLGDNIAITPGKVVHETALYQLIQYTPATEKVLSTPLVIFPPWINRYYILDLNPAKSFVRWTVEQGVSTFIVSWKSADASMADVVWDDYIAAQIDAIDVIRKRLSVPAVHAVGYCVAGTTLAATLAILARRGEADKVASATFFTAQVDFEQAGDLKHFVDDAQIEAIHRLSPDGYLDGRYMASTFNLLRSRDLLWSYVIRNYLLGEEYPAFDMLHWNGDVTNLPAKWHEAYLRDLYRDNRLAVPDSLSALGTPIDLRLIKTPSYIQAGREDHIAPPESVWKMTRHIAAHWTFVLAGSGHIAGVVNPPAGRKYQYWTNPEPVERFDAFVAGATENPGSWWPHWLAWLHERDPAEVPVRAKRKPGGRGDKVIEDAPGRYVMVR